MKQKLHLDSVNPGKYAKDQPIYEWLKTFNNAIIELSENAVSITTKDNKIFKTSLHKIEEDFMSVTFRGNYEDGSSFRLIRPGGIAKEMMELQGDTESVSIGSMLGDGYAVHFELMPISAPDKK